MLLVSTFHSSTYVEEKDIGLLVPDNDSVEQSKLRTGIQEMKEFQFYYAATTSLLDELGMIQYASLFAQHGISIDVLPLLNEQHLIDMGVTCKADRTMILSVILRFQGNSAPVFSPYDDGGPGESSDIRPCISEVALVAAPRLTVSTVS